MMQRSGLTIASTDQWGEVMVIADQIVVQDGALPWKPTGGSELVETYAYYDQPTLGLIRQAGVPYVFRCVDLIDERLSLWAYALIKDEEALLLSEAADLPRALAEVTAGKPFTVALADEEDGIFAWWFLDELKGRPSILDSEAIRRGLLPIIMELRNRLEHVTELVTEELTQ
jgi:hypothetical protein